jgi:hypothetical protein
LADELNPKPSIAELRGELRRSWSGTGADLRNDAVEVYVSRWYPDKSSNLSDAICLAVNE